MYTFYYFLAECLKINIRFDALCFYMHPFIAPRRNIEQYNKMGTKIKKIRKQARNSKRQLSLMNKSQVRMELQKKLIASKFKSSPWIQISQSYRGHLIKKSQQFKTAVKQFAQFTCSVCYSLMVLPTVLTCGHAFCLPCIQQVTLLQNKCCLCRKKVSEQYFEVSQKINHLIKTISVASLPNKQRQQYWDRYNNFIIWQSLLTISPDFNVGEAIHFYDEYSQGWRYGVITGLLVLFKDVYIRVQPLYNGEGFYESFQFHYLSRKIAKFQFFVNAQEFKQHCMVIDSRSRNEKLREAIQRRINENTIFSICNEKWQAPKLEMAFQKDMNIIMYLPPELRKYNYNDIILYTFDDFNNDQFVEYTKEEVSDRVMEDDVEEEIVG